MPDLAELVHPDSKSGIPGVDSSDDDVTRRLVTEKKHEIGALREAEQTGLRDVAEDRTIAKQHLDAIGIQPGEFPKWDAQKQSEKFSTSPIEAFGSLGSVVGMLASAFTHAPMQNALNASAAAMDAIRVGDEREYNRAFSAWKENNDLVFKRHEMEQRAFDDAMRLGDRDMHLMEAKFRAAAVQFGANKDLIMIENQMWPELFEAKAKIKKAITDIQGYDNQLTQERFIGETLKMWNQQIDQQYPPGSVENAGAKLQAAQAASFMMGKDIGGQQIGLWMAETQKKTGQFPDSDAMLARLRQVKEAQLPSRATGAHLSPEQVDIYNGLVKKHVDEGDDLTTAQQKALQELPPLPKASGSRSGAGVPYDEETLRNMAQRYIQRGGDEAVFRGLDKSTRQALNKAIMEEMNEKDITTQDMLSRKNAVAAQKGVVSKLEQLKSVVGTFEEKASKDGAILVELAKKVDKTGKPVVERWVRAGRKEIAGDTDVSNFHLQWTLFTAEAARLITSLNAAGVVTNEARKEMHDAMDKAASAKQIKEAVDLLRRDFRNRDKAIETQLDKVYNELPPMGKDKNKPDAEGWTPIEGTGVQIREKR